MGLRGELYSVKVSFKNRTYFFNIKENRYGNLFLNIVESKNAKDAEYGSFERQSVVVFEEDMEPFMTGFNDALKTFEKIQREKKRTQ